MQLNAFNWGYKFVMNLIKIYLYEKNAGTVCPVNFG